MSRAFPAVAVIRHAIHRPPWGDDWMREEDVYERMPSLTPEHVARLYFEGKLVVLREVPSNAVWLRPADQDWRRGWREIVESKRHSPP